MIKLRYIQVFVMLLIGVGGILHAQDTLYEAKRFIKAQDTLQYRIMYPEMFDSTKSYPLVLFLHGAGERGNDNISQLAHGSRLFASEEHRKEFPAIVIFPQCPKSSYWANVEVDRSTNPIGLEFPINTEPTTALNMVMQLVDSMALEPFVKKEHMYVGGLSMGGMGTFEILYRKPDRFAAAFAICGAGNPEGTQRFAETTPLWIFHGAKDDVVNPQASVAMVSGILKYGGKPNFTLYAKDNHNSWDTAFAEPELLSWLFSNSKS
ncbi:alpha/beta hydrolase-fold protein [Mariniflexile ostreae]|uniref:Alpha/beta hydrolase-fold protein n=1 Tax=Mariniflexile ostreae TaxID=1520892 RepID=A0ABV5F8R7_9FLAO